MSYAEGIIALSPDQARMAAFGAVAFMIELPDDYREFCSIWGPYKKAAEAAGRHVEQCPDPLELPGRLRSFLALAFKNYIEADDSPPNSVLMAEPPYNSDIALATANAQMEIAKASLAQLKDAA